jgi:hypothetical protein
MKKTLLILVLMVGSYGVSEAQVKNPRLYDAQGNYAGQKVERPNGDSRIYSNTGKYEGREVTRPDGSKRVYDKSGQYQGTVRK